MDYKKISQDAPHEGMRCIVKRPTDFVDQEFYAVYQNGNGLRSRWMLNGGGQLAVQFNDHWVYNTAPVDPTDPSKLASPPVGELKGEDSPATEAPQPIKFKIVGNVLFGEDALSGEGFRIPASMAFGAIMDHCKKISEDQYIFKIKELIKENEELQEQIEKIETGGESSPVEPDPESILASEGWYWVATNPSVYRNKRHPNIKVVGDTQGIFAVGCVSYIWDQCSKWDGKSPFLSWLQSEVNRLEGQQPPATSPIRDYYSEGKEPPVSINQPWRSWSDEIQSRDARISWLELENERLKKCQSPVSSPFVLVDGISKEAQYEHRIKDLEELVEAKQRHYDEFAISHDAAFVKTIRENIRLKEQLKTMTGNFESASQTEDAILKKLIESNAELREQILAQNKKHFEATDAREKKITDLQSHLDDAVSKNAELQMEVRRFENSAFDHFKGMNRDAELPSYTSNSASLAPESPLNAKEDIRQEFRDKISGVLDKLKENIEDKGSEADQALRLNCYQAVNPNHDFSKGVGGDFDTAEKLYQWIKNGLEKPASQLHALVFEVKGYELHCENKNTGTRFCLQVGTAFDLLRPHSTAPKEDKSSPSDH